MTFSRTNGAGWGVNDEVTSAQLNSLDIDHANALDKTAAGDTLSGTVALAATGKLSTSGGGSFELKNNDYVKLGAGHTGLTQTRAVNMGVHSAYAAGWSRAIKNVVRVVLNGPATSDIANVSISHVLPPNATLTQVDFIIAIKIGHGALPANQPNFVLVKSKYDGTNTPIANVTMAAANVSAYENLGNIQTVTLSGLTETVDKANYDYIIAMTDEYGTNSASGNAYYACLLHWTIADVRGV